MTQPAGPEALSAEMQRWLAEAQQLRTMVSRALPQRDAHASRFYEALHYVRAAQDRMEELLGNAITMRGGARRWARSYTDAAEDAFDARSAALRSTGRGQGDYSTGRERQADVNLQILGSLQTARAAQRMFDEAEEILERLRLAHRGIDTVRQDLNAMLRYLNWDTHMER
jgi:hypothetical protein